MCGRHHTSVLTDKGQVFSWGASSFGRLGLPDPKKIVGLPTEVPAFRCCPLAALACGDFHVLGLGVDGRAYAWGYGSEGQGGLGATLHLRTPRPVEGLEGSRIAQIACGAWWSMVVTEAGCVGGKGRGGWRGVLVYVGGGKGGSCLGPRKGGRRGPGGPERAWRPAVVSLPGRALLFPALAQKESC